MVLVGKAFVHTFIFDNLVRSSIYFAVDLKRQVAVLHALPNCRLRHYAPYIELFWESIPVRKRICLDSADI